MSKHYPRGLDDRMRDKDGEIHKKRSDTLMRTPRDEYGDGGAESQLHDGYMVPVESSGPRQLKTFREWGPSRRRGGSAKPFDPR